MRLIYDWFLANEADTELLDINHLHDLPWLGDDRLPEFMDSWFRTLGDQQVDIDIRHKEKIFYRKIKKSTALRPYVDYYDRLKESHEDHTYTYLEDSVVSYIHKTRQARNLESHAAQPALPKSKAGKRIASPALPEQLVGQCPFHITGGCRSPETCTLGAHDAHLKGAAKGKGKGKGKFND